MKTNVWTRLVAAMLIVLLLWWLYMALLVDESENLSQVELFLLP